MFVHGCLLESKPTDYVTKNKVCAAKQVKEQKVLDYVAKNELSMFRLSLESKLLVITHPSCHLGSVGFIPSRQRCDIRRIFSLNSSTFNKRKGCMLCAR